MSTDVDVNDNGYIDIAFGGTNAGTAAAALDNLGAIGAAATLTADMIIRGDGNNDAKTTGVSIDDDDEMTLPGTYIIGNQNLANLNTKGTSYWFDGDSDWITVSDDPNVNFGTGDFSIISSFSSTSTVTNTTLIGHGVASSSASGYRVALSSGNLVLFIGESGTRTSVAATTDTYNDGSNHITCAIYDRSDTANIYIDGVIGAFGNISSLSGSVDSAEDFYIGTYGTSGSGDDFKGQISSTKLFNLALDNTDPIDKAIINGGDVPFKYVGASQTEQTSGTLTIGKTYRLKDWITADDFTNIGAANNADDVEFVATGTTPTTWTNSSIVVQIGCVLDLSPTTITPTTWVDVSGNDLDGTVIGAVVVNPLKSLYVDGDAIINGAITAHELSADPSDPVEGSYVTWQSDGTGSGDDGDIMVKITAGAVTKTTTWIDFDAI